jgi:ribosomal-protein-alanine N-acetyltransferase
MSNLIVPGFTVRPISIEDAGAWAAYACLPEVKLHTSSTASSVEDVEREITKTLANDAAAPIRFVLQQGGQLAATVGFHTISPLNRTAEITYDVAPALWGQGIATAACRAATHWGLHVRGWHRVQATTVLLNAGSQRVLERCGFKREGQLRNFRVVRGEPATYWLYSALPGEVTSAV